MAGSYPSAFLRVSKLESLLNIAWSSRVNALLQFLTSEKISPSNALKKANNKYIDAVKRDIGIL